MIISGQVAPLRRLGPLLQFSLPRGVLMVKVQLRLLRIMFPHGKERPTGSCRELPAKAHSHLHNRRAAAGHPHLLRDTPTDWSQNESRRHGQRTPRNPSGSRSTLTSLNIVTSTSTGLP
ncbi:hypothetical protein NDU88_002131 [Pleurodeles waltl]|uniref:Uncharacterized protein n=1 Tax=Pleurodeles waltl TaxID=8319 RepID=A0AAV7U932_PLEWA|nr:hypothetical protein NDU88_002131 [Pleurodeles waltl]